MSDEFDIELVKVDSCTVVSVKVPRAAPVAPPVALEAEPQGVGHLVDETAPTIMGALPDLSDADLLDLEQRELAGKTRKGLMAAILTEREARGV